MRTPLVFFETGYAYKQVMKRALAGVAEQVDAQDLKSCGPKSRTGSIPVLGTMNATGVQ